MNKALPWLCTFLAGALVLAGCGAPEPAAPAPTPSGSPRAHEALAPEEVWVASSVDGKRLNSAVYRPDVPEGTKVPVFINFSPYWGDSAMTGGDPFAQYMVSEYVPRGYAVVLSAVRGTGHSEGCFQIGGDLELQDTWDVIEHFANQPWSSGAIGAGGKSYDSTTQNGLVAKNPHPALKTLFHVSGITDMYAYNQKAGVPYFFGLFFNHYYWQQGVHEYGLQSVPSYGALLLNNGGPKEASTSQDEDAASLARLVDDAACTELPTMEASGLGGAGTGIKDAYWQERDWAAVLPDSTWEGSVFFVHGLQDWNVKPDHIEPWLATLADNGVEVKGWLHQWQQDGTGHVYPMRGDWNETMLRWLDHYLKGVDNGIDGELGFELQGTDGVWRAAAAWPPQPVTELTLTGDATGLTVGPFDHPVRFAGTPEAKVQAMATGSDPILRLLLVDVGPEGDTWANEGVLRVGLSDDLRSPMPYTPASPIDRTVRFYPMDHVLAPGHTLELRLGLMPEETGTTSTPPQFVISPAQGDVTYQGVVLTLPEAATEALAAQPADMPCFAC